MSPRSWKVFGAVAVVIFWVTWPGKDQVNPEDCSPRDMLARISANIHGGLFWQNQLAEIKHQRERAEGWDQYEADMRTKGADEEQKAREFLETFYENNPRAAPSPAQRAANALRARADRIEDAESQRFVSNFMRNEAAMFARCEEIITARIRAYN